MSKYDLTLRFNVETREVVIEKGINALYKNSIGVNKVNVLCDGLTLGQLLEITFSQGENTTNSLTMLSTTKGEYYVQVPDVVLSNEGECVIALLVKSPVVINGETKYNIITSGNVAVNVINSVAEPANNQIEQSVADQIYEAFLSLDESVTEALEMQDERIDNITGGFFGHSILDSDGVELPQRSRMQFMNATVTDDGTQTIIRGIVGEKGEKGDKGDTGTQGIQGEKGERGERGQMAVPYVNQNTGVLSWTITDSVPESILSVNIKGPQGVQGVQGMQGAVGPAGPQGVQGVRGEQGIQGEQGAQGAIGAQGPQGIQGIRGEQGIQGEQGVQGIKGEKGDTGATGPMGPQGERGQNGVDGRSFVLQDIFPTLGALKSAFPTGNEYAYQVTGENREIFIWSERGNDWESLGALQGPMGPQGIQGERGEKGEKGDTGAQGLQGIQGVQGLQGERGEKGEKGDTGAQGEQGIQGVQGLQGEQGIQGLTGPQGVQGVAGLSAYNIAVLGGYLGSESQFTESLINIGNKVNVADFNALKGVGYTTETVRDNAVSIQALKGVGYVNETVKGNAESIALLDSAKADKTSVYTKVEVESLITASIGNVLNGEV